MKKMAKRETLEHWGGYTQYFSKEQAADEMQCDVALLIPYQTGIYSAWMNSETGQVLPRKEV